MCEPEGQIVVENLPEGAGFLSLYILVTTE
jgi:hypothetical protein